MDTPFHISDKALKRSLSYDEALKQTRDERAAELREAIIKSIPFKVGNIISYVDGDNIVRVDEVVDITISDSGHIRRENVVAQLESDGKDGYKNDADYAAFSNIVVRLKNNTIYLVSFINGDMKFLRVLGTRPVISFVNERAEKLYEAYSK